MKKLYLFAMFLFIFIAANAQLPMLENFPELLPPPPGPPDACDMGGTYSVGPGGDFTTLTEALDTLKARGVSTNVILELNSSYNSSTETFPIIFPKDTEIPCYGGTFSLILRPAAGVANAVITGGSNAHSIIRLDSCTYVTIDGRPGGIGTEPSLLIANDSTGPAVDFYSASNNHILYTKLQSAASGFSPGSTGAITMFSFQLTAGCNYNTIRYCELYSPVVNASAKSTLLYAYTENSTVTHIGDSIINCKFYNFSKSAIQLENYTEGWEISGNSFYKNDSYTLADEVSIIKINTPGSETQHNINGNFFGGTQPECGGSQMQIPFNTKVACIEVNGQCAITGNRFTKLSFYSNAPGTSQLNIINVTSISNITPCVINNNNFGMAAEGDSIYIQNNSGNNVTANCIFADGTINYHIDSNVFSGIRPAGGPVTLAMIFTNNGGARIRHNQVGIPSRVPTIINYTDAPTYGIFCVLAFTDITDNTICDISNYTSGSSATVQGIVTNRGVVDSICRNRIFHLGTDIGINSEYAPVAGISVYPDNAGGAANLIEGNIIHSLYNGAALEGGSVTGILVKGNLFLRRNFIHSLNSGSDFSTSIYGIQIPDKESVLENNMISLGLDSAGAGITKGNLSFYGIAGGHVLRHNSVYIGGIGVEDGFLGSACYVFIGSALNTEYHNNIFVNNRSNANATASAKHQCIDIDLSYTGNYNMFYANGQGGILGTYQNTRYNTLAQWQSGSGKDANSFFADPNFIQPAAPASAVNLHLSYSSPAEAAGNSNNTIIADYDNEPRASLTPVDIGADAGNYAVCPVADAGPDYFLFEGGDVHLGGLPVPNVSYLWRGPDGFTSTLSNPIITPVVSGQYTLIVTSGNCSDSDFVHVTVMPAFTSSLCPGSNSFLIADNTTAAAYQWQVNTGNNIYSNISNNSNYAGVTSDTLNFINIPSAWYGYKYRCVADGVSGMAHKIQFKNTWTGVVDNFWSNPANWSCNSVPDGNTDVVIDSGTVVLNQNGTCRTLYVAPGVSFTINTGFTLTITH